MSFDWFWNIPRSLDTTWTQIVLLAVCLCTIALLLWAWSRAVRQKERAIRQSQEHLAAETERYRKLSADQQSAFDATLAKDRAELELRGSRNLEQAGRMADERAAAMKAAHEKELADRQQAAEMVLEETRLALEQEKDQVRQEAELKESQLRMDHADEIAAVRQQSEELAKEIREEAVRQMTQTTDQANHSIEEARARFAASLAEQSHKHAQEKDELKALHADEIRDLQSRHAAEIDSLKAQHAASLEEAARQHSEELSKVRGELESTASETGRSHAAEIERVHAAHAAKLAEMIQQHGDEVQRLQAEVRQHSQRTGEAEARRGTLEAELIDLKAGQQQRLSRIKRVWDEPPMSPPPRFVPASERKTRFLSVANLKGGVGKTTVAGNAGISLACRGHRVLLVDLDFQGSLTQVAVERTTLTAMVKRYETARALFERPLDEMNEWLEKIIHPVECMPTDAPGKCDIIGAWNDLADVELREEARWILQPESDARYRIREIFHRPEITDNYDYVIFDCPPRLTTAAVNALAASDGVIIPIMLDWQSAAPILYMLRRLRDLKPVLTGGRVIGMVANQVRFLNNRPVQQMQSIFEMVCKRLDAEHLTAEDAFRVMVKADQGIGADVNAGRIAAARPAMRSLFEELTTSIERVSRHESLALV